MNGDVEAWAAENLTRVFGARSFDAPRRIRGLVQRWLKCSDHERSLFAWGVGLSENVRGGQPDRLLRLTTAWQDASVQERAKFMTRFNLVGELCGPTGEQH